MQEKILNGESMNIVEDNIEKLKSIFPDVFTEGKVDFDKLQDVLGNYIEKKEERYNFTWNGKSAALRLAQTPSTGTLRPCKEESKDWDTTENLYIEGDNLEVLKLLQKSYHNKIKMIYIDPPYNTGNDFIYKDDFKDNLENYKKVTGQIDEDGNKISTNSESDGRYHTNWLNMMYPRLKLARNLLTDDGVIFISIDDNELNNIQKLCNEIFGEENFVACVINVGTPKNNSKYFSIQHEYVLVYSKLKSKLPINWAVDKNNIEEFSKRAMQIYNSSLSDDEKHEELLKLVKYPRFYDFDHYTYVDKKGVFRTVDISAPGGEGGKYDIIHPITQKPCKQSSRGWAYTQESMKEKLDNNLIFFGKDENFIPSQKYYLHENTTQTPRSVIYFDPQKTTKWLKKIGIPFDYVKPLDFIVWLVNSYPNKDIICLDFFSGSGTTAHAIMQLNSKDNANRKFIMVQLPELTDEKSEAYKAGYKNICEIGKERIRRAGDKIKEEIESNNTQLKLGEEPKNVPDIGFKVFKLDTSNIKKWNGDADTIESEIQGSIFNYEVGRSELDVVYEIMLKCGLDLTYPIEEINVNGKTLYSIGAGAMFVCMDDNITQDIADKIVEIKDTNDIVEPVAVFKDNGFTTDSNKTNIKETLRVAGIKDFITV